MARSIVLALLAAIGSSGPFESCYGVDYRLTVMPDGSGKMEVLISQKLDPDELKAPFPYLDFVEATSGFAAFTLTKPEVKDGWRHARLTCYFDNLNKVMYKKKCNPEEHVECIHFAWRPTESGFVLSIADFAFCNGRRNPKENWEEIRKDGANLVRWKVTMPGKVSKVRGFQKSDGRSANYERSSQTIKNVEDAVKWPLSDNRFVECEKTEIKDVEEVVFRTEMSKAKEEWPKVKSDLEAAAAKQVK